MIEKNEIYEVEVIDNGYQGEGIAKINSFPIFIQGAIAGEKIEIKILKVQSSFAYGKIMKIIRPAKTRATPECKDYSKCGGCNLRHIEYNQTLEMKKAIVENCLYKSFGKELKIKNVIGMEKPLFYRNKLQYPLGIDKDNKPIMGIFANRSHNIIPIDKCYIQNETCEEIARYIFEYIKSSKISEKKKKTLKGTIRHIIVKIGIKTNDVLVTIVVNDNNFKEDKKFVEYLTSKFPNIKTIVKNYNMKNTNVILGNKNEIIYGDGYIYDILGEYKFKISSLSFYQVNPIQTEILYNTAMKYIKNDKNKIALDLYCGIGTIGIFASKYFKRVYGIEIVEEAIENAKENAKINNIKNIEFYAGDVEKVLPEILKKEGIYPNTIFVDPPRKGLDKNTSQLLNNLEAEQIIYISCNPATLARDLKILSEKYEIKEIQPVDMFPYTRTCGMRGCYDFERKLITLDTKGFDEIF